MRLAVKSSSARARALAPSDDCRPASPQRRISAARSDSTSPGGTTRPDSPSRLTQGTPVGSAVLMTGRPASIASTWTMPNASCRLTDGSASRSQRQYHSSRSASDTWPRNRTESAMPSSPASASSAPRSGPSPTTTSEAGTPAMARNSTSTPL